MTCHVCKQSVDELRLGVCWDCASAGEARSAHRTVRQHLWKAIANVRRGRWDYARIDVSWAWERLTRTGDYSPGGTFDREGYDWRRV